MCNKPRFTSFVRDVRVILSVFLLLYILFALGEWQNNNSKHKELMANVNILRQMQEFAEQHCKNTASEMDDKYNALQQSERQDATKDRVDKEVTFILLGPTVKCLANKVKWLKNRYKEARIFVALDAISTSALNKQVRMDMSVTEGQYLGRFTNTPEALNHAIQLTATKYFLIIDYEIDLAAMHENFIDIFHRNIPGYDVLSGSVVNTLGQFSIPCQRLRMKHWSYYESFQYNISGNILQCDATSLYFIARTEAFRKLRVHDNHLFDNNLTSKWAEDFFFRFQDILRVGILPDVVIKQKLAKDCFDGKKPLWSRSDQAELVLPFAKKHQLFNINNEKVSISVCKDSKTLACSEEGIQKKWKLKHWTDGGLSTYPFIIESLKKALYFGTKRLEESSLMYVIEGGTLLGMVKLRDILPWDHGDIDTFVYSTRRKVIDMVKETFHEYGYEFWLRHSGFHTYVSDDPALFNGCIVYLTRRVKPKAIVYMKHGDKHLPVRRDLFRFLRQFYGSVFLENHMKISNQRSYCMIPKHHACMPDCRWSGCGGRL